MSFAYSATISYPLTHNIMINAHIANIINYAMKIVLFVTINRSQAINMQNIGAQIILKHQE